jgi:hypothetical protein
MYLKLNRIVFSFGVLSHYVVGNTYPDGENVRRKLEEEGLSFFCLRRWHETPIPGLLTIQGRNIDIN